MSLSSAGQSSRRRSVLAWLRRGVSLRVAIFAVFTVTLGTMVVLSSMTGARNLPNNLRAGMPRLQGLDLYGDVFGQDDQLEYSSHSNSSRILTKAGRAVLVFLPEAKALHQLLGLFSSWKYVVQDVLDIDLVVVHSPAVTLPQVMNARTKKDGAPNVISVPCDGTKRPFECHEVLAFLEAEYQFIFQTTVNGVLAPMFASWAPSAFQIGSNTDSTGKWEVYEQIATVSQAMGLYYRGFTNLGTSFYGTSKQVLEVLKFSEEVYRFLAAKYPRLADNPQIVRELAINHVVDDLEFNGRMEKDPSNEPEKGFGLFEVTNIMYHIQLPSDPEKYKAFEWRGSFSVYDSDLRYSSSFGYFHSKRLNGDIASFEEKGFGVDPLFPLVMHTRSKMGYDDESPHYVGKLMASGSYLQAGKYLNFNEFANGSGLRMSESAVHVFHFREGLLRYKYLCAEGTPTSDAVVGKVCRGGVDKRQIWELRNSRLVHLLSGKCLSSEGEPPQPRLTECSRASMWKFT